MLNINLEPEYIAFISSFPITNTFFTSVLVSIILIFLSITFYFSKNKNKNICFKILRVLIFELLYFIDMVTQDRSLTKKVFSLIATFFLFIVSANILSLVPGFLGSFFVAVNGEQIPILRSPNSDLNITLALALWAVVGIQFFSLKNLGLRNYISQFINFSSIINFVLGFFEMISEGIKIFSFSFRLFGNIFAGEVLLLVIAFLAPYFIPLPFMVLEVFVGVIQAFIFAMLTLTFIRKKEI